MNWPGFHRLAISGASTCNQAISGVSSRFAKIRLPATVRHGRRCGCRHGASVAASAGAAATDCCAGG